MRNKTKNVAAAVAVSLTIGTAAVVATAREKIIERKGVVSQVLMNPEGEADGLLLDDGTQIKFPPHMSSELRANVAVKDAVTVKGVEEGGRAIRGDTIVNDKSGKALADTPPTRGGPPPPPPRPGRESLARLTAEGKITRQLFGPRGDVNGVLLASGTQVRVGPRVLDDSKVSLEVGKSIRASGFGTKNQYGEAMEATEIENR